MGGSGKQLYNNIVFHSVKRIRLGKNAKNEFWKRRVQGAGQYSLLKIF